MPEKKRGRGRPPKYPGLGKAVKIDASLPKMLVKRLDAYAKKNKLTRSAALAEAVSQLVNREK